MNGAATVSHDLRRSAGGARGAERAAPKPWGNVKAALALAGRAAVLVEGKERMVARCSDLLNDDRIAELYLGRRTGKQFAKDPK